MSNEESPVKRYLISLCDLCMAGEGGECHTPGCALWINRAPDISLLRNPFVIPVSDELYHETTCKIDMEAHYARCIPDDDPCGSGHERRSKL